MTRYAVHVGGTTISCQAPQEAALIASELASEGRRALVSRNGVLHSIHRAK